MKDHEMQDYTDLLRRPHPTSPRHPRMPISDRAAQFASFAALTGYEDAVEESARLTDREAVLTADRREELDAVLRALLPMLHLRPEVRLTYFVADQRKAGGAYHTCVGRLMHIDVGEGILLLEGGARIPLRHLFEIECAALLRNESGD